jgi:fumarate hydratase class I
MGDGTGPGAPYIHFHQRDDEEIRIRLMLKGGGSENASAQYKLPDKRLGAGRDLKGVKKCVVDAVFTAQGKGCGPGVIGVGIGGDRITCFQLAKEQFFRNLDDSNEDPVLDEMEKELETELNTLGIGPMGFGGRTTVLGVKIGAMVRHPACYFVSIAYMCWACRRGEMTIRDGEVQYG